MPVLEWDRSVPETGVTGYRVDCGPDMPAVASTSFQAGLDTTVTITLWDMRCAVLAVDGSGRVSLYSNVVQLPKQATVPTLPVWGNGVLGALILGYIIANWKNWRIG